MANNVSAIKRNYQMIRYDNLISPHENGNPGFNRGITGINRHQVNMIKRKFDPNQVSPIVVSFRDGKYNIVDGQHTALAIYELNGNDGSTLVYCDVREGLTLEQEAQLFYDLNTNKRPVSAADKIWSLVIAKNSDAVEFKELIERCGYTFGRRTSTTINPINACWKIFNSPAGADRLENILTLINDTWPDDASAVTVDMLRGMNRFLEHNGYEFDRERFVKTFSTINHRTIVSNARSLYKSMSDRSYTMTVCVYMMIVTKYNKNLRSNKIQVAVPA